MWTPFEILGHAQTAKETPIIDSASNSLFAESSSWQLTLDIFPILPANLLK